MRERASIALHGPRLIRSVGRLVPLSTVDRQAATPAGRTDYGLPPRTIPTPEEDRMNRRLLAVLVAGLLIAAPAVSHAQSISLAGGLSMPVGDLADTYSSGYNGTVGFNFGAPLIPIGARLEGSINGFEQKNSGPANLRVLSATVNGIVGMGMPYLIGGIGYYNVREKVGTLSASEGGLGFNIGGGITLPLPTLSPFVEVRYHQMVGDNDSVKFVPITFGIKF
jgi:hypothetical protein